MPTEVTMLEFCRAARQQLCDVRGPLWAVWFIELRMQFCRHYSNGLICSTTHGVDFFDNILAGAAAWDEKGEYGDNFRKICRLGRS